MGKYRKSYLYFDLLGMIASGLLIGYERQITADSGELIRSNIVTSLLIASSSYLLVFLLLSSWKKIHWLKIPAWVLMAALGAVICSFNLHVVYYAIYNWRYRQGRALAEYIWWLLPDMSMSFLVGAVIYLVISLSILGVIRLFVSQLNAMRGV